MKKTRLLFVCLGNICRSPSAEAVMKAIVEKNNLSDRIECDSAGTSGHHIGEAADTRSIAHAKERGYDVTSLSRAFDAATDFADFDYILAMDNDNYANLLAQDPEKKSISKIYRMVQFGSSFSNDSVPDPYYEGPDGFELVLDLLEDCCSGLLKKIQADLDI